MPCSSTRSAESVVEAQLAAYNARDLGAWLATYAPDAEQCLADGTVLARGRTAIGDRMRERFADPKLQATLLHRTVVGDTVVDQESVRRTGAQGIETVEMVCVYAVSDGLIRRATFAFGPAVAAAPPEPGFVVSCDPHRLDRDAVHAFLSQRSRWARGIPKETMLASLAHSLCFGGYLHGQQVAFARVVTDYATFAWIADVFVIEGMRGRGFSKRLMEAITTHPRLQGLRRWVLTTRDAHGLYAQFGFEPLAQPERFMERHAPDVYAQAFTPSAA